MKMSDVVELIRVDMPDHTEGAFDVRIESDDGGSHITVRVEDHDDSWKVLDSFSRRFKETRIIVMKVPPGSLHGIDS